MNIGDNREQGWPSLRLQSRDDKQKALHLTVDRTSLNLLVICYSSRASDLVRYPTSVVC